MKKIQPHRWIISILFLFQLYFYDLAAFDTTRSSQRMIISARRRRHSWTFMKVTKAPRSINILGKGFGKRQILPKRLSNALKQTLPGEIRKLEGHYKRLLERQAELFNEYLPRESTGEYTINDIYARSEISSKAFFIGRIIYPTIHTINDTLKSLEILLVEYAKTLHPYELSTLLLIGYPQLYYAPGYSTELVENYQMNLTRYYHFNKDTNYYDYTETGFQPKVILQQQEPQGSTLMKEEEEEEIQRVGNEVGGSYVYCDDNGNLWEEEQVESIENDPTLRPIYVKKGVRDVHGMMDKLLEFSQLSELSTSEEQEELEENESEKENAREEED